jgi:hypothetical protein
MMMSVSRLPQECDRRRRGDYGVVNPSPFCVSSSFLLSLLLSFFFAALYSSLDFDNQRLGEIQTITLISTFILRLRLLIWIRHTGDLTLSCLANLFYFGKPVCLSPI